MERAGAHESMSLGLDLLPGLEASISCSPLGGAPMGPTLNDLFFIELLNGGGRWDARSVLRDVTRFGYWAAAATLSRSRRLDRLFVEEHRGKVVCTSIGEQSRFANLIGPVIRQLGAADVLVVSPSREVPPSFPGGVGFLSSRVLSYPPARAWWPSYLSAARRWSRELRACRRLRGVSWRLGPRFHSVLLLAARRLVGFELLLRELRPSAVVTEYDRNAFSAPLILAARALGIPTFTLLHGLISLPYGYTPLAAETVFVWGRHGKRTLTELGVAPRRIVVGGCPLPRESGPANRETTREAAGLPPARAVVLLATNPVRSRSRRRFVEAFCAAFAGDEQVSAVVRLHPSESLSFYSRERERFPGITFLENRRWSLAESLEAADVVVCHNSGYGLDAMARGRPVVVLGATSEPLGGARAFVEEAGCPLVETGSELAAVVGRILGERGFRDGLLGKMAEFVGEMYESFGDDAAARIAADIRSRAEEACSASPGASVRRASQPVVSPEPPGGACEPSGKRRARSA